MRNLALFKSAIVSIIFLIFTCTYAWASDIKLTVKAKGTKANGVYAHFKLLVNDLECGSKYTSSSCTEYCFTVPFEKEEIKTIQIVFDNDQYFMGEDRNLFVNCIYVGDDLPIKASTSSVKYIKRDGEEVDFEGMMEWNGALVFDLTKIKMHPGNVTLNNQADVDNFSFDYVKGDLLVSGNDIKNLEPLSVLVSVKGTLVIKGNPNLKRIAGLNSLIEVGLLHIQDNHSLSIIDGFNSLYKCGGMHITDNPSLNTIKCLHTPGVL